MQLISLGNNIINLDLVSVLDIDQTAAPNVFVVHVHTDSNQPIIDITIPFGSFTALMNMVPIQQRLPGTD